MNSNYETPAAGNLPNAAAIDNHAEATRIDSSAGPDICVSNVQDLIESGALGESALHVEAKYESCESKLPATCQDDQYVAYSGNGR
jgi:hypothetical protein